MHTRNPRTTTAGLVVMTAGMMRGRTGVPAAQQTTNDAHRGSCRERHSGVPNGCFHVAGNFFPGAPCDGGRPHARRALLALTVAPRLHPENIRATMLRTTTLLLVMVLVGDPATALACEFSCSGPAHHRTAGCHDASASAPDGPQVEAVRGCHHAVAGAPFLTEAQQAKSRPAPTVLQPGSMTPNIGPVPAGSSVFRAQPPRGPLVPILLRI